MIIGSNHQTSLKIKIIPIIYIYFVKILIGRSRRVRHKAHMLDDPFGNPYDGLKVLFWPPYEPHKGPLYIFTNDNNP